jgi:ABC-type thiamin/hydroxymethylpyrimidine transport system permease subunit
MLKWIKLFFPLTIYIGTNLRYTSKELAFITVISALGSIMSVQVGYLGNYLKTLPLLPLGTGQMLSGLHLIPLTISGLYIEKRWVITTTSTVKGLLEAVLFSFHGLPVILMSILQGMMIDLTLITIGNRKWNICIGCGLASASNVAFLQFFLLLPLPSRVFILMYLLSFSSGIIFGGYGGKILCEMINTRLSINN